MCNNRPENNVISRIQAGKTTLFEVIVDRYTEQQFIQVYRQTRSEEELEQLNKSINMLSEKHRQYPENTIARKGA